MLKLIKNELIKQGVKKENILKIDKKIINKINYKEIYFVKLYQNEFENYNFKIELSGYNKEDFKNCNHNESIKKQIEYNLSIY